MLFFWVKMTIINSLVCSHVHARTVTSLIGVGVPRILNNLSPTIVTLITEKIDEIVQTPACNGRVATLAAEQYVCTSFGPHLFKNYLFV
jgi:hypothetical protein